MSTSINKVIKILLVFVILFNLITNNSYALVNQSSDFFVNDTSQVLTQDTKDYIININKELESKTGSQIVVVTVDTLDGLSVEDYTLQLFRKYRNRRFNQKQWYLVFNCHW